MGPPRTTAAAQPECGEKARTGAEVFGTGAFYAATRARGGLPGSVTLRPQGRQDGGVFLLVGQNRVTGVALADDRLPRSVRMAPVVAPEATGRVHVADIAGVGAPGHLHLGKDVGAPDLRQHAT